MYTQTVVVLWVYLLVASASADGHIQSSCDFDLSKHDSPSDGCAV